MLKIIVLIVAMGLSYTVIADDNVPIAPGSCADRPVASTPELIEEGRRLFKEQTFDGNGRTCETCHREDHNLTIDAEYIATLPNNDPLFVAENNPDLHDLENPVMMRRFGLILLNTDGFDNPGVLRGVPPILGLSQTTALGVRELKRGVLQPVHETGWSADGAPDDGSLRCFPVGAIVQHFTNSMDRVTGVDFRLPTEHELDALLVYMLDQGRQSTPVASSFIFMDPAAERGKTLFFGDIPVRNPNLDLLQNNCSNCHVEAGADNSPNFVARNRVINSNLSPNAPACRGFSLSPPIMDILGDGGFGSFGNTRNFPVNSNNFCGGTLNISVPFLSEQVENSHGFFNTSSLYEAADTGPYFHDNSAETLEDAIRFYSSAAFANSNGAGRDFVFGPTDVNDLSAFLRAINALENARSAIAHIDKAMAVSGKKIDVEPLQLALADSKDGIKVLTTGPLPRLLPKAANLFRDANLLIRVAIASRNRVVANLAKTKLAIVRSRIVQ